MQNGKLLVELALELELERSSMWPNEEIAMMVWWAERERRARAGGLGKSVYGGKENEMEGHKVRLGIC